MDKLWTACRFLGSVASYYITPTPPDFEITHAETEGIDITPGLLVWLALQRPEDGKPWNASDRLVVQYRYKGSGPYLIYFEPGEEFVYPPVDAALQKPLEYCLVSVEVSGNGDGDEPLDISERGNMFAGPSGRWDGRLPPRAGLTSVVKDKGLDLRLLHPNISEGTSVFISFANGDEIELIA